MDMDSVPTILCIDDFKPGLQTRKSFLEQFGFNVLTASSGAEGLQLLQAHHIDAIVLDYRMPEMDGEELANKVRQISKSLPLLLLSGFVREVPENLRKIVNAQLVKGDPPGMLIEALDNLTHTTFNQRRVTRDCKKAAAGIPAANRNVV
ncbi:MAG: response regulator receiver protein [Candidatus Angelobacter sp.]|jgi:two-component system autoinducer 1 sensor kinase/phosphatase LuxN|nr:response regulator receiver protein [Candidatus Angelobacter sp.]